MAGILLLVARPGRAEPHRVLRFGLSLPEATPIVRECESYADELERLSGAGTRVLWLNSGSAGDEERIAELIERGELDGGALTDVGLARLVPALRAWQYPGLFRDYLEVDMARIAYRDKLRDELADRGLVLLAWIDVGFLRRFSSQPMGKQEPPLGEPLWLWAPDVATSFSAHLIGWGPMRPASGAAEKDRRSRWLGPALLALEGGLWTGAGWYVEDLAYRYVFGAIVVRGAVWRELGDPRRSLLRAVSDKYTERLTSGLRQDTRGELEMLQRAGLKVVRVGDAEREAFLLQAAAQRASFARFWGVEEEMGDLAATLDRLRAARGRR